MVIATFRLVRTNPNKQTTSKRTPQFSVGISKKWPYHLPSLRNFRNFLSYGQHPWFIVLLEKRSRAPFLFWICVIFFAISSHLLKKFRWTSNFFPKNFLYFTNMLSINTFLAEVAHRHLRSLKSSKTPMVR